MSVQRLVSGPAAPVVVTLALVGGYLWLQAPFSDPERLRCDDLAAADLPKVVMYGTDWCQFCMKTRWLLEDHGVRYCEYDIEQSQTGRQQFQALRGGPIPLILVDGERVNGFDKAEIKTVLRHQGLIAPNET